MDRAPPVPCAGPRTPPEPDCKVGGSDPPQGAWWEGLPGVMEEGGRGGGASGPSVGPGAHGTHN